LEKSGVFTTNATKESWALFMSKEAVGDPECDPVG